MAFHKQFIGNLIFALILILLQPACLKTRAQLKNDGSDGGGSVNAAEPRSVEGSSYALEEIKGELTRLSGRIEHMERSQGQSNAQNAAMKKLEMRMIQLEEVQIKVLQSLKRLEARTRKSSAIFQEGKAFMKQGRLQEAASNFSLYLQKSPKGKNAAEALLLRGEAHYRSNRYDAAIKDYNALYMNHKKSRFITKAIYKLGLSMESLGEKGAATTYYEELVSKYPKSSYAKMARSKLNYGRKPKKKTKKKTNTAKKSRNR